MKNWSTDTEGFEKNPERHAIWKLEQLVNFGLDRNEKIDEKELRRYFGRLTIEDPSRRKLFELLLGV
ncbi:MAG TPA: hypothetical protein VMA75_05025 [Candidatus Paceibacterota bacterium]|nr:hypothetical protein [Candidatus Paceibacterota bacterium]